MEERSFLAYLMSWFPMLLLIAVWIFYMRRSGPGSKHIQLLEEYRDEMKITNQHLDRIVATLEKR